MAGLPDNAFMIESSSQVTTAADDFSSVTPFEVRCGAEQRVPFVFSSPHSGRFYPPRFLALTKLDGNVIKGTHDQ